MRTTAPAQRQARCLSRRQLLAFSLATGALGANLPAPPFTGAMAQTPVAGDFDALTAELATMIEESMATLQVPGVGVGVIAGDEEYTAGFGVTSIEHPLNVDADTLFQLGSIAKTYTGTIMMRLVEAGTVELDAPVRTYLPDFRVEDETVSAAVTVRQLLNHSGGWLGDDFTDTGTGDDAIALYVEAMADNHQIAPLGRYFSYNNSAFIAAGRVIEVVTGQTYLEALTAQVLEPLELERTFLYPEQVMTEAFAVGHTQVSGVFAGDLIVAEPWALPRMAAPAGSHIASIKELMRYARFHLGEGANAAGDIVLTPEAMPAFRIPTISGGALGTNVICGVGVGWWIMEIAGTRLQMHGGSTNGQESLLILVPGRHFAIGLLTNASAGADLNTAVSNWALERFLGLEVPRPTPLATPGLDLGQFVGRYRDGSGGPTIVIGEDEGALTGALQVVGMGELPADGPLVFVAKDLIQVSLGGAPLLADFVRTESGEVGWLRFGGRLQPRLAD